MVGMRRWTDIHDDPRGWIVEVEIVDPPPRAEPACEHPKCLAIVERVRVRRRRRHRR